MRIASEIRRRASAGRPLDDAQHLQGIEMVGPMREHLRIELLCFRQLALFVQRKRLREDLRHIEWCGLGQLRWRHEHPLVSRGKKAALSRLGRKYQAAGMH
jgi:hypothetical protein